jgi:hypothetical protein
VHRDARERSTIPARFPRVGLDLVDRRGQIAATADDWDGVIATLPTLAPGTFTVMESSGLRLAYIETSSDGTSRWWFTGGRR